MTGWLSLVHQFGANPQNFTTVKFVLKNLKTSYLDMIHECDKWTDRHYRSKHFTYLHCVAKNMSTIKPRIEAPGFYEYNLL